MKTIKLVIIIITCFFLIGCDAFKTSTTEDSTTKVPTTQIPTSDLVTTDALTTDESLQELVLINDILTHFSLHQSNGYNYQKIQLLEQTIMNSDLIEQRIQWQDGPKVYTEKTSLRLLSFNLDSSHQTDIEVTFYNQNQKGYYNENNFLLWEDYGLNDYLEFDLKFLQLRLENIESIYTENLLNIWTYTIAIKDSSTQTFFADTDDISNLIIVIVIDIDDEKLISVNIEYNQTFTETFIEFSPYYDQAQVIIPE